MGGQQILVLGATGRTGRRVVDVLRRTGHRVRAASRNGPVRFDWSVPDTWRAAVTGAEGMYLMAPDGVAVDPALVQLAVDAGVRRIALLSSGAIEEMGDDRLLAAEQIVREAGVRWTILRPSWFDQNFDEGFFEPAVLAGRVVIPVGDVRQTFVDAGDIAAVAATVLTVPGHEERTYEVRGPQALSFGEVIAIISRVSGRSVCYAGTEQEFVQAQMDAGNSGEAAIGAAAAFAALRARGDDEPNNVVFSVTGREATTFDDYTTRAAACGAWK